jgi:hypothetical protein
MISGTERRMLLASLPSGLHTFEHLDASAAGQGLTPNTDSDRPPIARPGEMTPYQPIGLGKPLTVVLERVYPGNFPDTLRWVPGTQSGDILVTSAHKGFGQFEAAPRAIHMLKTRPTRCRVMEPAATEQGSRVAYYSPAVTEESISFTFEMSVDRDFSSELGDSLSKAFTAAGALPVFAPVAPYLVAAGAAIPIADKALNLLARPHPFFGQTIEIPLALPGMQTYTPGILLIVPDEFASDLAEYTLNDQRTLEGPSGETYVGDIPYIVISLDGTEQPDLKDWSQHAASATIVERFFGGSETLTQAVGLVGDALSLYNDVGFQRKALAMKEQLASAATDTDKQKYQALLDAYTKNIGNVDLRKTLDN